MLCWRSENETDYKFRFDHSRDHDRDAKHTIRLQGGGIGHWVYNEDDQTPPATRAKTENVKRLRAQLESHPDLSVAERAELLGVSKSTVERYLRSFRKDAAR
jgi:hypothetical protein